MVPRLITSFAGNRRLYLIHTTKEVTPMFTNDYDTYVSSYPSIFDLSYPSTPRSEFYPRDYSTNEYASFEDPVYSSYDNNLYC